MIEQEMLEAIKQHYTWEQVTRIIERVGVKHNRAMWWQICAGQRTPTRKQRNAIRSLFPGWPMVALSAVEAALKFDIQRAIIAADDPDVAVLLKTDGLPIAGITAKTGVGEQPESIQARVSKANRKRSPKNVHVVSLDTRKGHTGNREKIQQRIAEAVAALNAAEGMTAGDAVAALGI